jgi:S1-C subfamily serine protease
MTINQPEIKPIPRALAAKSSMYASAPCFHDTCPCGAAMKKCLTLFFSCILAGALGKTAMANPEDLVVKVFASVRFPNPVQPWARVQPAQSFGTGLIIEGKRILTNAHVVAYGTEIYVEDRKGGEKLEADVQTLNFDVDLAILTLKDEKFFNKRVLLPRAAELPRIQDRVSIYGFPIGGNDLSTTRGEVSRIEYGPYGRGIGPVIQVSAAINPGNSGGPAVVDGKMIGLVFSRVQNAQNIGSLIPNEEIETFLDDVKRGRPSSKATLASLVIFQPLENKALRRRFKVDPAVRGVLVQVPSGTEASSPLQPYDVLTKIGDYPIDNLGLVQLKNGLRAPLLYLVPRLARDQAVAATVWRRGREMAVSLPVTRHDHRLVRPYQGEPLSYFIHGPLVFAQGRSDDVPLYARMNRTFYLDNSPLVTRADDLVRFPGEELVVVSSRMLPHASTKGYADPAGKVVKDLNGQQIKNLGHLVELIRDCKEEFLTFRFADNFSEVLVFDRKELEKATEQILDDNGIPLTRRGSPNMLKVWKAR